MGTFIVNGCGKKTVGGMECSSFLERVAAFSLRFSEERANEADCADSLRDNGAADGSEYEAQGELHETRRRQRIQILTKL